jgi:imidazolonepropionase-like amidohydrolase
MHPKRAAVLVLLGLGLARGIGCLPVSLPAGPYALGNLVLIDGSGAGPRTGIMVLVAKGRIEAVGAEGEIILPKNCPRIDLEGAYLLPGFINAHVHDAYNAATLRAWLSAGVTSVRDLGPQGVASFLVQRDRLNKDPLNARIISATPLITRPGGYGSAYVDGAEEARAMVRSFADRGVDLVKVAIEDDLQGRTWPMLGHAEVSAVVGEAHARGLRVSAHISHVRNLSIALGAGVDDLAHMVVEPLPLSTAREIAARGIAWVPTLELWKGVSAKHGLDWIRIAVANTALFFRAGGTIALGTDFSGYSIPFDTGFPITEARLLREAGLSPLDVITAGTRNAALVSGRIDRLGTVEKGKIADLVVVKDNPVADIGALEHPLLVIKEGVAVPMTRPAAR